MAGQSGRGERAVLDVDRIDEEIVRAAGEHLDQTWAFATANRDALLKNMEALGRYAMFAGIVGSSADPRHADMMEAYMRKHFGPDAVVEAERVGNGVRIRAAQKARLLPQVRAALK